MTRLVPLTVLVMLMVMVMAAGVTHAQGTGSGSLPNGTTLAFDKLYIHENGNSTGDVEAKEPEKLPDSLYKYFNLAHCQCAKDKPTSIESTYEYLVLASGSTAPISEPLQIWVGASCNSDVTTRNAMCHQISGQSPSIATIQSQNNVHVVLPLYDAMNPEPSGGDCHERVFSATVWGLADSTIGSGQLDYSITKSIQTDAKAPPLPEPASFRASGGDGAIQISWKPNADTSDVFAYQALCARADTDAPGKMSGRPPLRYMTASTLCGLPQSIALTGTDLPGASGAPDAGATVTLPPSLLNLDPAFLCGETTAATADGLRIDGLENGVPYKIVLLVVDQYQNARGTYFTSTVTPVPSTDFWEDIHDKGSKVEGGLCLLAETYGDDSGLTGTLRAFRDDTLGGSRAGRWLTRAYYATLGRLGVYVHGSRALRGIAAVLLAPVVGLALLWHWLTLPGALGLILAAWLWRRRRGRLGRLARRILATRIARLATALAVLALGAGRAHAGSYEPYWEDPTANDAETQAAADEAGLVKWHTGIRVGPYVPDIDKQLGMDPGPYKQAFGGSQVLPMLDIDRILWTGFGQVGVGVSLGYMQKSAHTRNLDGTISAADKNTFRLIPAALTATYRFTWLDDEYGIPVIPYVRGGLSYYAWWLSLSSGDLAKVCKDGGTEPTCDQNKALGASLGVQGSIGLAIRGERIDASAARSMRASGIQHAGIYGELSAAQVDGFGSDKKLSVGARTWFAGVDFEF